MAEQRVWVEKDYGKAFRSRPGSADWRPRCSCGWIGSRWQYESEARETAKRHLDRGLHARTDFAREALAGDAE